MARLHATLAHEPERLHTLDAPALYDPEIVFFMNGAETDADEPRISCSNIRMAAHSAYRPEQFPHATRWILHNADQQVAAFALPSTCRRGV